MKKTAADLYLLAVAIIWGGTFSLVKKATDFLDPIFFIGCRFVIASIALGLLHRKKLKMNLRSCLLPGVFLGLVLGSGFVTQTYGIKLTSASTAGFITGLNIVFVAVMSSILSKKLPSLVSIAGTLFATAGLLVMSVKSGLTFSYGDILVLICAIAFGLHIVLTEKYAQSLDAGTLTITQLLVVASVCIVWSVSTKSVTLHFNSISVFAIIYCGLLATALAFLVQTLAQRFTSSIDTAIAFSTEPLFAALFAILFLADPVTPRFILGGLLIFAGMILVNLEGLAAHRKNVKSINA